jgi:hypothetical protein
MNEKDRLTGTAEQLLFFLTSVWIMAKILTLGLVQALIPSNYIYDMWLFSLGTSA